MQITEDEKVYLILNKDTGEVFDLRLEQFVDIARKSEIITCSTSNQKLDIWKEFWEKLDEIHQDLLDAADTGNIEQV